MKICVIKVHNLASLHGVHKVDLETGPLGSAGLFAITGPTGAGKSTLLDAVCLALYDSMPRLIGARTTAIGHADEDQRVAANSVRSVLRRDATSGYAEVEFRAVDGLRYRSRWAIHRARNRPGGALQAQTITVENLSTGQLLGGTKTQLLEQLTGLVGLTFDQFRRSVLLAQGDFAAFLEAKPAERAELLERMTGTAVYAGLSRAAFERHKAHKLRVQDLVAQVQALGGGDPAVQSELRKQVQLAEQARDEAQDRVQELEQLRRSHAERSARKASLDQARAQHEEARKALDVPWREQLLQAERVGPARLQAAARAESRLQIAERDLAAAQRRLDAARVRADQAAQAAQAFRAGERARGEEDARREQILAQARVVQDRLQRERPQHSQREQTLNALRAELEQAKEAEAAQQREQADLQARLERSTEDAALAALAPGWAELERDRRDWLAACQALERLGRPEALLGPEPLQQLEQRVRLAPLLRARADRIRLEQQLPTLRQAREAADEARRRARDQLARLQVEHRIQDLNAALQPGNPCPVCGATEHPEAGREAPRAQELQQAERRHHEADQADRLAAQQLAAAESALEEARRFLRAQRAQELPPLEAPSLEEQRQLEQQLWAQRALSDWTRAHRDLTALPPGWDQRVADPTWWDDLGRRVQAAAQAGVDQGQLEARRNAAGTELALWAERRKALATQVRTAQQELAAFQAELRALEAESKRLAPQGLDAAEQSLQALREQARQQQRELDEALARANTELGLADQAVSLASAATEQASKDAALLREELGAALLEAGVGDMRGEALSPTRVVELRRQLDELEVAEARAAGVVQERQRHLDEVGEPPPLDGPALTHAHAQLVQARTEHARQLARLEQLELDRARASQLQEQLDLAEEERRTWAALDATIGSATGNKFRAFAQGLTLDRLLAHANQHLLELAPRYRLLRVPQADLELQVVDQAMADEARSVNSLSGGETFMVSLALALGLSSMSSASTRVESLFIDEGFGSLDRRTLEIALATLDALQATGRKVGVISHVQGLGEHIGVQIRVVKEAPGRSRVEVPGT